MTLALGIHAGQRMGVSTANAHPLVASDRVSIVHNGIIENHRVIRQRLEGAGHQFQVILTRVLAHLFLEAFDSGMEPVAATQKVLAEIEGACTFAVMAIDYPDMLIVARNASPLVLGIGDDACYIGSDAIALSHLTRKVVYLKDHDFALVRADGVAVYQDGGVPVNRQAVIVAASPGLVDKGGYRHFMEKEIHEQPDAIAHSLAAMTDKNGRLTAHMNDNALRAIDGVVLLAAGTSHYATQIARYWIESLAAVPVACEVASEYQYRQPATSPYNTAIAVSQSGESLDTLMAMRHAAKCNMSTIGLVNVPKHDRP